jgi:RNA polymerase sigma-70 factor (ECF subfamily)
LDKKQTTNSSDQHLVDKVLRGDTKAFEIIIKNTKGLVAQIVFKMVDNAEDRRDIAQDVFLKTFKDLSGFRFQSKLSTWIGKITYNTCLNYLEKKKVILVNDDEYSTHENALEAKSKMFTKDSTNETESLIFKKELSEIINFEIANLSPIYKTLITLYHGEELSYEEIAQITELPEGTVKNYLFRARKVLKERLLLKHKKEELL